jgi:membrane-associated phospholipid phosphatase
MILVSGFLLAVGLTEGITQCIKMYVGRLRPNMYQLCQFDIQTLQYATTITKQRIREGHLSFPSGHSSLASVSMIYCTWCLLWHCNRHTGGMTTPSNYLPCGLTGMYYGGQNNGLWVVLLSSFRTLSIVLLLPGWAIYVGTTRIVDHWHHVSDVLAGLLLGSLIATIIFHTVVQPVQQYVHNFWKEGDETTVKMSLDTNNDEHH